MEQATKKIKRIVNVWRISMSGEADNQASLYELLSDEEKRRADRLANETDQKRFVVTRGCLKQLLAKEMGVSTSEIRLTQDKYGKPYLPRFQINFNVAHSQDCILIAWSRRVKVGVDVEQMLWRPNFLDIARRYYSKQEFEQIKSLPEQLRLVAFYRVWTRKEAFVKAVGRGIAFGLQRFSVTVLHDEAPRIVEVDGDPDAGRHWSLLDVPVDQEYAGAVCANDPNVKLQWHTSL